MKPTVYIETTVISYLTARPSRDLIVAAHQQITLDWWEKKHNNYDFYVSEFVLKEASKGDATAAQKRMDVVNKITLLRITDEITSLGILFMKQAHLPKNATEDALHIATATVHQMDYLVTWNCKHIANAEIQKMLKNIAASNGYELPLICTPEELLGEFYVG
ncbi:MAG: type II toxin-antitoxin system VapC family toxin [Ignavibacteriales bacterium]|nr:type II toxin-antitoxin system VapC family toxin [Ignavibacteriales bacterium]